MNILHGRYYIYVMVIIMKQKEKKTTLPALLPQLELHGNRTCIVEGLKSISEYSADKIKINLGTYSVVFQGDGLFINSFSSEGAILEGTILSVGFESHD